MMMLGQNQDRLLQLGARPAGEPLTGQQGAPDALPEELHPAHQCHQRSKVPV